MKKHPIDELFVRELGTYDLEPSQRAKELFQKRIEEKNRQGGSIWMTKNQRYYWWAASVVLLLGIGWWGFSEQISTETKVAQASPKTEQNITKPSQSLKIDNNVVAEKKHKKAAKKRQTNVNVEQQPEPIEKQMPIAIDEPIQDELTLAITKAQNRKIEKERVQRREQNHRSEKLFNESVGETMIVITEIVPEEETILIPEMNSDSPVSIAQAEKAGKAKIEMNNSFLAKVYTGFKQLKHGEKVDLTLLSKENQGNEQLFALENEGFIKQEESEIKAKYASIKRLLKKNKNQ